MGFDNCLYFNTYELPTAVTFQFSRIGNDPGVAQLLIDLDSDPDLREFIDGCQSNSIPGWARLRMTSGGWYVIICSFSSTLI